MAVSVNPIRKQIQTVKFDTADRGSKKKEIKVNQTTTNRNENREIIALGESVIKMWKYGRGQRSLVKKGVYKRFFRCQRKVCIKDYMKSFLRERPDHLVLHVGKNYLDSERQPDLIAKSIADVAGTLNIEKHDVSISSIWVRNEKLKLKQMMLMSI